MSKRKLFDCRVASWQNQSSIIHELAGRGEGRKKRERALDYNAIFEGLLWIINLGEHDRAGYWIY